MAYAPLNCAGLVESRESLVERIGIRVPILGWCVAALAHDVRVAPFVREINGQLKARPRFPGCTWGTDRARRRFVRWIARLIRDEFGWPNHHFHPDDPVRLVCWAHDDALDDVLFLLELEDELGCQITEAECETLWGMTLGEAVDFLLDKASG